MNSWKTTLFGLMAAIGGAVLAGTSTGLMDISHLPAWVKDVAGLLSVIGTAGIGFSARDNDKSSEDVGIKASGPAPSVSSSVTKASLLLAGLLALFPLGLLTGCSSTPARVAYDAASVPAVSLDQAMTAWGDYVAQFHPSADQESQVKAAFAKVQAAELEEIDAAHVLADYLSAGSTNSIAARAQLALTGQAAADALGDLVNLLRQLGVKL